LVTALILSTADTLTVLLASVCYRVMSDGVFRLSREQGYRYLHGALARHPSGFVEPPIMLRFVDARR
jgi:hypothetical protein